MGTRDIYRALSLWKLGKAILRGPVAVFRFVVRRRAHRGLARVMRRGGL